jgi:hypothetical protein
VIIRENSEGMYPGREGELSWLAQKVPDYKDPFGRTLDYYGAGKFALRLITQKGTERIARYAVNWPGKENLWASIVIHFPVRPQMLKPSGNVADVSLCFCFLMSLYPRSLIRTVAFLSSKLSLTLKP